MRPLLLLLLLVVLPAAAGATDLPLWEAGFGAGLLRLPHYRGSNQNHTWLLPVPYFVYRGQVLKSDRDGTRALLVDGEVVDFDLSLAASAPTNSRDDVARAGMPNLAPTIEIGPKLNANLARGETWKLDLRLPVRSVLTLGSHARAIGWSASPVINLDLREPGFDLGLQTGVLWGDRRLHGYFYDVAPAYASANRPAYQARGGYAGWQATAALSRRSGNTWMGAYVRSDSVAGAAFAASPLVTSRQQWSVGFAVAWVFATSESRVSAEE